MARPTFAMKRTSFLLALPLIALSGFALSFYSPRGAQAGYPVHAGSDVEAPAQAQAPQRDELVHVNDGPPAPRALAQHSRGAIARRASNER